MQLNKTFFRKTIPIKCEFERFAPNFGIKFNNPNGPSLSSFEFCRTIEHFPGELIVAFHRRWDRCS